MFADNAIVYYLPNTTGWGPTFGGRPTRLWNPVCNALRLRAGALQLSVTGTPGIPIALESSTHVVTSPWLHRLTTNLLNGQTELSTPVLSNTHAAFYRLAAP